MKRFKFDWLVYLIFSAVFIALGIIMLPEVTDLGSKILNIVLAIALVIYCILFLFPKIKKHRGTIQILVIIEFVIVCLVAIGLVLVQFKVFEITGVVRILGLVIWLRSVVELFRAYFYRGKDSSYSYPVWLLCIYLVLITFGTYIFASPFISDQKLVLIMAILFLVVAIILIILGIVLLPKSKSSKTSKSSKKSKK